MTEPLKGELLQPEKRSDKRDAVVMRTAMHFLRRMGAYREQAERGLRSVANAAALHDMAGKELIGFLNIKLLVQQGLDYPIDISPTLEEAPEAPPPIAAPHRTKRVTIRRGTDKLGQPIDEKTVTVSQDGDPGADEFDDEIEVLT